MMSLPVVRHSRTLPLTENDSIFAYGNKYYTFNINHPIINKYYKMYCREIGETLYPLSDIQRMRFEKRILTGKYPEIIDFWR